MKIIAIGDIHGRDLWKKIVTKEKDADKIIFVGDYFDSFDVPGVVQIYNFKEIIEFKKANIEKVELLIGNHDYHYMKHDESKYSGFQRLLHTDINEQLKNNSQYMKICHCIDDILFVHAGVTRTWCENVGIDTSDSLDEISNNINALYQSLPTHFGFIYGNKFSGRTNPYGDNVYQSPLWVRPNSLREDKIPGMQIVGHSHEHGIYIHPDNSYIVIDVNDHVDQYLIIEDGKFKIGTI